MVAVAPLARTALLFRAACAMFSSSSPIPSPSAMQAMKLRVGLCQIAVGSDKAANIKTAQEAVREAASQGARLVVLPECWNSPYSTTSFPEYAEPVPEPGSGAVDSAASPSTAAVCDLAREAGIFLVGGSVPERDDAGKVFNTCVVAGPNGAILAKHRKVHLFDIDVPGKITFRESDTLTAGDRLTAVETPFGAVGVGICYDMRFPELALALRDQRGCRLLCFPGAFNLTTGPAHWELLQRARAVDNQCFVLTASPARVPGAGYQAWGHSSAVSPWGEVVATTGHEPAVVMADLDLGQVDEVRTSIPVSTQKRADLYHLETTAIA